MMMSMSSISMNLKAVFSKNWLRFLRRALSKEFQVTTEDFRLVDLQMLHKVRPRCLFGG